MPAKILLADDSITIQKIVHQTFEREPYELILVGNGEAAIRQAEELHPDLILADIFMPGKDGYEVCSYVKQQPELASIPVVLLVGAFDPFDEKEANRVQADGHLKKPFAPKMLLDTVHRFLPEESRAAPPEVSAALSTSAEPLAAAEVAATAPWSAEAKQIIPPTPIVEEELPPEAVSEVDVTAVTSTLPPEHVLEEAQSPQPSAVEAPVEMQETTPAGEAEEPLEISHVTEAEPMEEAVLSPQTIEAPEAERIEELEEEVAGPWPLPAMEGASASIAGEVQGAPGSVAPGAEVKDESAESHPLSEEFLDFRLDLVRHSVAEPAVPSAEAQVQAPRETPGEADRTAATMEELIGAAPPSISEAGLPEKLAGESPVTLPAELSEEMIDAIARRVVEKMSARVIEEIAWEVIPEMTEALLRKKISKEK